MDFTPILFQIDTELERLERLRSVVSGISGTTPRIALSAPRRKKKKAPPNQMLLTLESVVTVVEPRVVILPPKPKREYIPRVKAHAEAPRALMAAVPSRPVFVPKAVIAQRPEPVDAQPKEVDLAILEAEIRNNLLGKRG